MEIDYLYYSNTYGGKKIPADRWTYYSNKAIHKINYLTFNKAEREFAQYSNEIKQAICAGAELIYDYELRVEATKENDLAVIKKGIKSESVKSHSKTYETSKASEGSDLEKAHDDKVAKVVRSYLIPTGLMYRGL